jgi:uncharacterized RDD family membrane protein YckC
MSGYDSTSQRVGTPLDPAVGVDSHPELFQGVISKRIGAFIVDAFIIVMLTLAVSIVLLVAGLLTFFLSWLLLGLVFPAVGLGYNALTVGGPSQATIGMRIMGVRMRMWHGGNVIPLIAAFHALLFWLSLSVFCPILLWALVDRQKRCVHDILAGVLVVNDI